MKCPKCTSRLAIVTSGLTINPKIEDGAPKGSHTQRCTNKKCGYTKVVKK